MEELAEDRMNTSPEELDGKDWFFCTKKIEKEEILDKVLVS